MDFVQLQINYLDWNSESVQSRLCYETAVKHLGKQVVIMEPIKEEYYLRFLKIFKLNY